MICHLRWMIYSGKPLIYYFHCAKIKKPPPIWKRKQLYHPFTYPPICAQDYGRAPSLITRLYRSARSSLIHSLSQARLGSDIRAKDLTTYCHGTCRLAHTPYRDRTVPDSLCHFCAATVFVTVFRFFTHRFYYKYFKKSILF